MPKSKKFGAYAARAADGSWIARIVRRRTSRGAVVERERPGFGDQESAQAWADEQLASYLARRKDLAAKRRESRAARRTRQAERAAIVGGYSYRELALRSEAELDCRDTFKEKAELLWQEVAFRMLKEGASDDEAFAEADARVGRKHRDRLDKAKSGILDTVSFSTWQMAIANAQFLAHQATEYLKKGRR